MKHKKMRLEGDFSSSIENYEKQLQFHVRLWNLWNHYPSERVPVFRHTLGLGSQT